MPTFYYMGIHAHSPAHMWILMFPKLHALSSFICPWYDYGIVERTLITVKVPCCCSLSGSMLRSKPLWCGVRAVVKAILPGTFLINFTCVKSSHACLRQNRTRAWYQIALVSWCQLLTFRALCFRAWYNYYISSMVEQYIIKTVRYDGRAGMVSSMQGVV